MRARKLLFYINSILYGGGAERAITNIASLFSENGYQVIMVTSFGGEDEFYLEPSIRHIILDEPGKKQNSQVRRNLSRVLKLRAICKRENPDIIISFMAESNYRALVATFGLKAKNIISVRSDPNREYAGIIGRFLGKHLLPFAEGCVFQTEDAKNWFPKKMREKSRVFYNIVRDEFYETEYMPIPDRIVTCGRLEEPKNHELLIEAFTAVAERYPKAELLIYGEGSRYSKLQQQINNNKMNSKIHLMGGINNVSEVLAQASIFVLSSVVEGMPNALMEAMAVGVPCIATDCPCGGPRMLIDTGRTGILIKNNELPEMISAIELLLSDTEKRSELGKNAKRRAERYRGQYVFQEWAEYVEYVLCNS